MFKIIKLMPNALTSNTIWWNSPHWLVCRIGRLLYENKLNA
jgi:hypothetical protein